MTTTEKHPRAPDAHPVPAVFARHTAWQPEPPVASASVRPEALTPRRSRTKTRKMIVVWRFEMPSNPYEAPRPTPPGEMQGATQGRPSRTPFILAGIGAVVASAYWAAVTVALWTASASRFGFHVVIPCVLMGLCAVRGFQVLKGDFAAAKKLLWIHCLAGALVLTLFEVVSGGTLFIVLQGVRFDLNGKVVGGAIHVFGALTAYVVARRAPAPIQRPRARSGR